MKSKEAIGYYRTLSKSHDVEAEAARLLADASFLDGRCFPTAHRCDKGGNRLPYREVDSKRDASKISELSEQTDQPRRREEYIAMQLFAMGAVDGLGAMIDYQTPIGGNASRLFAGNDVGLADGYVPGKIDLLSYDADGERVRILELKVPDSGESLLRCSIEAYTYLQLLDVPSLVVDMQAAWPDLGIPDDVRVVASPLVFEGSIQHRQLLDSARYPRLHELLDALHIECLVIGEGATCDVSLPPINLWNPVEFELSLSLRDAYSRVRPDAVFADESDIEGLEPNPFYLEAIDQNLICPMDPQHVSEYRAGDGSELDGKMRALRSSSAMTFNLLGNAKVVFRRHLESVSPGVYSIRYEAQLATLKASVSTFKANLDALLVHEGGYEAVACEMKMMEWLQRPRYPLASVYLDADSYDFADDSDRDALARTARRVRKVMEGGRYDGAQMFRHAVALLNDVEHGGKLADARRITLLNCVWRPGRPLLDRPISDRCQRRLEDMALEEERGFRDFQSAIAPIAEMFARRGVEFAVCMCTPRDMLECMEKSDDERRYLQARY